MTEFALAPTTTWDAANSPYRTPRVMLEQNFLQAYRVRGNGTMRHVSLYPVHSTDREAAEYISDRTEMDGASVTAVARELHISTATVRRFLEGLELTEEIEAGDWDDLIFDTTGQPVFEDQLAEDEDEAPQRTRTARKCACGVTLTLHNRADKVEGAVGFDDTCVRCYTYDGWVNTHSDNGHSATNRDEDCPVCSELPAEPTISENAPGANCEDEPTGTTADDVESALAASLAQKAKDAELLARNAERIAKAKAPSARVAASVRAGGTPTRVSTSHSDAPKTAALAVCFCGDQGAHGLGTEGCKNSAPVVRKVRNH